MSVTQLQLRAIMAGVTLLLFGGAAFGQPHIGDNSAAILLKAEQLINSQIELLLHPDARPQVEISPVWHRQRGDGSPKHHVVLKINEKGRQEEYPVHTFSLRDLRNSHPKNPEAIVDEIVSAVFGQESYVLALLSQRKELWSPTYNQTRRTFFSDDDIRKIKQLFEESDLQSGEEAREAAYRALAQWLSLRSKKEFKILGTETKVQSLYQKLLTPHSVYTDQVLLSYGTEKAGFVTIPSYVYFSKDDPSRTNRSQAATEAALLRYIEALEHALNFSPFKQEQFGLVPVLKTTHKDFVRVRLMPEKTAISARVEPHQAPLVTGPISKLPIRIENDEHQLDLEAFREQTSRGIWYRLPEISPVYFYWEQGSGQPSPETYAHLSSIEVWSNVLEQRTLLRRIPKEKRVPTPISGSPMSCSKVLNF